MAKDNDGQPRKRFSKSGHTTHGPRAGGPPPYKPPPVHQPPPPVYQAPPGYQPPPPVYQAPPGYQPPPAYEAPPGYQPPPAYEAPPGDGFSSPTYNSQPGRPERPAATTAGGAALLIGRSAITQTNRAARTVTRKVIRASKADGALESGLTALIWNQVLSYGTDAMITVSLAGTVFFGASANAQRGNVLLYLLITMAPFAVVAPVIGPALDRLQHGRRWTMAGTALGRGVLALVMAAHATELLVLYPCALGSLVLSKAYGVVRAAAAPRLVPQGMTLTSANARLTIFGLGSTLVLGGVVGVIIKITGSYSMGLVVTACGFFACGFFAFRLPKQVDSAAAAPRHPGEPVRPRAQAKVPPISRIQSWAKKGFDPHLVIALQGESVLRLLSGLLTIYLAFYVESTQHGLKAALELGLVIGAAGVGNFLGTAIGTRLHMGVPELLITICTCAAGAVCLLVALSFDPAFAAAGMLVASVANALSKIALDALIQRDVVETLRSSAFARSETFLQLAWVIGAAIAVALPSKSDGDGALAFVVAGVITLAVGVVVFLRHRVMTRAAG
ncbi:MAG: MFS transporter [Jatrophihabitans sp.]|uniref:MFS transporter n=1 Tax=Jatrophihabitans sp. TaxID=1932789 RepID=UPI0039109E8E